MGRALRVLRVLRVVGVLAVSASALGSCAREEALLDESACVCPGGEEGKVVDGALVAYLSRARAAHHAADLAEEKGEPSAAIAALERLVAAPAPERPEVAEVLADARARLADLRSAAGKFDAALREVDAGLALVPEPSHFRGHLLEVRGLVHERRAKVLAARGDEAGAGREREAAIEAFEQAIGVQEEVIRRALPDAGAPRGPR